MNQLDEIQKEAAIRLELENLRAKQNFEYRVKSLMSGISAGVKYEWPYTSVFDDGCVAFDEAKRRLAALANGAP